MHWSAMFASWRADFPSLIISKNHCFPVVAVLKESPFNEQPDPSSVLLDLWYDQIITWLRQSSQKPQKTQWCHGGPWQHRPTDTWHQWLDAANHFPSLRRAAKHTPFSPPERNGQEGMCKFNLTHWNIALGFVRLVTLNAFWCSLLMFTMWSLYVLEWSNFR